MAAILNVAEIKLNPTENDIICEKCLLTHFMQLVSFYTPWKHLKTSGENEFEWKLYYKTKPSHGLFEELRTESYSFNITKAVQYLHQNFMESSFIKVGLI